MVKQSIHERPPEEAIRRFTKSLLEDLQALERMLEEDVIEADVRRIGAEQEMFIIDQAMRPALRSLDILRTIDSSQFTTELGLFNLEVNLRPRKFTGACLWRLEQELLTHLARARRAAEEFDCSILLTGILPTMKQKDLTLESMSPVPRYHQLNRTMVEHSGGAFNMLIKGLDELRAAHDNVMFEACNTSFQVHFQVGAPEFAKLYNFAQAVTAPVLAAAVNSPVFLQHRLWNETRVALFQQSVDTRSETHQARQVPARVIFGEHWVENSVIEIFREDIARFRVLLATEPSESPLDQLDRGVFPKLPALCLHNGTVYRWNRPCYGVINGKPHLRIEHRALPAGPTVIDEIANAAFFYGLMSGLSEEIEDIRGAMEFDHAKNNFLAAARYGLKARLHWVDGESHPAEYLILEELLPLARRGLAAKKIRRSDISRYLDVLEERVRTGRTGTDWILGSLASMDKSATPEQRFRSLTASMYVRHLEGRPVHEWPSAKLDEGVDWRESYRTVEQVMTRDLFTVGPEDLVDLAANLMDWEHIRHVPVENSEGRLVGLITHRQLLRLVARGARSGGRPVAVREVMTPRPITVTPDIDTVKAIELMREHRVSCLPVVNEDDKLVGIVSERDFINVAAQLLEEKLRE